MFTTLKRILKLGIEIASITKEEAEKEIKKLVKSKKISTKQGKALVKKMLEEAEKQRKHLKSLEKEGKAVAKRVIKKVKPIVKKEGKALAKTIYKKAKKRVPKSVRRKIMKVKGKLMR